MFIPARSKPHCDLHKVHVRIFTYNVKSTYLSFWCFLYLCRTTKTRLHVVTVCDLTDENKALKSDYTDSVNMNSSRLQTTLVKARAKTRRKKKLSETLLLYRSVNSERNKRVKEVALDCIVIVSAHWRIDLAQLFFDRIVPRWTSGVRTPPLRCDSPPAFLSVYPANLLSPSMGSHMISLPTAPFAVHAGARTRERV